ncbi:MAG: DNA transformation protein [Xanthobacteraceae bacterium]|nr:MAG: DNA transformation protein [Xanthobacteraceae bacterium]
MAGAYDPEFLIDLFAPFARVSVKRMFSGYGIYREGLVFAWALAEGIFLKTDEQTAAAFEAAGLAVFVYPTKDGLRSVGSYRRMPDACLDDENELRHWAGLAWQAALRAPPKTPAKRLRRPSAD